MNIFVTDTCPIKSAQALDNQRLVKMVLETAQILSTALRSNGVDDPDLYRPTHARHPCVIWAGRSEDNFSWVVRHGLALSTEFYFRYGHNHRSRGVIFHADELTYLARFRDEGLTQFANCTPYKSEEIVAAYRRYMRTDKWTNNPSWGRRGPPEWR